MRHTLLPALALLIATAPARTESKSAPLFNGKDLTGFEGLTEQFWSVKDGALVGYTPKDPGFNTFLCSKKKYRDFEMTFQVRLKGGVGNSGVQIRSKILDPKKFSVSGPQVRRRQGLLGQSLRRGVRRHDEGRPAGPRQEGRQGGRFQRLLHQVRRQPRHDQGQRRDDGRRRLRNCPRRASSPSSCTPASSRWK